MTRTVESFAIDARPRGPRGPYAREFVRGRPVLDHVLDAAESVWESDRETRIPVHVAPEDYETIARQLSARPSSRFLATTTVPLAGATLLRTNRLYEPRRLRFALRAGKDPEA